MKLFFETTERINQLNKLLLEQRTGTPDELARRIGVSRSRLYQLLDELKDFGAPIVYSKAATTFLYSKPFSIHVEFYIESLSEEQEINVGGGESFILQRPM